MSVFEFFDGNETLQDAEAMVARSRERPVKPIMKDVLINERLTRAIVWTGKQTMIRPGLAQTVYFFPIPPLDIPEWEFVGPTEWEVLFMGMMKDVPTDWLTPSSRSSASHDDQHVAVIRTLPHLLGMDHEPMWRRAFITPVVQRVMESGELVLPNPYLVA